jgi:cobalamin biosynthesis protein CobT
LEKIARTFADDHGIRVEIRGTACCFDYKRKLIRLPANIEDLGVDVKMVLEGMLDHETLHAEEYAKIIAARAKGIPVQDLLETLPVGSKHRIVCNAIEDIRIEWNDRYEGRRENTRLVREFCRKLIERKPRKGLAGLLSELIFRTMDGAPGQTLDEASERALARLVPSFRKQMTGLEQESVPALAEEFARVYEEEKKQEEEKSKEEELSAGSGGGEDAGEGNGNSPSGHPIDDGDRAEAEEDEIDERAEEEGDETLVVEEEDGEETPVADLEKLFEDDPDDVGDPIEAASGEVSRLATDDAITNDRYVASPEAVAHDKIIIPPNGNAAVYQGEKREVSKAIAGLRSKLQTILIASKANRTVVDCEHGRIDQGALHRLATGTSKRVFSQQQQGNTDRPAVGILIDESGSMAYGNRSGPARKTAIALSETLNALGVRFGVYGFSNHFRGKIGRHVEHKHLYVTPGVEFHGRSLAMVIHQYKGFSEQFSKTKTRLLNSGGRYENADGDAVLAIGRILMQQQATRHVLIVLSDGEPLCPTTGSEGNHLKEVVADLEKAGVEVVGIGIQTDAVKQFYPNNICVRNLDELAPEAFKVLSKMLLRREWGRR